MASTRCKRRRSRKNRLPSRAPILAAAGIVAGLLGATLLSQVASSMMFEISAFDPVTFVAAPIVLAVVALAACYAPARRATRVDPVTALRG